MARLLKGVVSKNLQNPIQYICGRGSITAGVTVHTMLTSYHSDILVMLGATDDRDGYHWSWCHTPPRSRFAGFYK